MTMCTLCRRTLLAGEEFRLWRGGRRDRTVCALCEREAAATGWLRLERPREREPSTGLAWIVRRVA